MMAEDLLKDGQQKYSTSDVIWIWLSYVYKKVGHIW